MSGTTVDISDDVLEALTKSPETAGNTLRMAAAAQLAGMSRSVFLTRLAD